MSLKELLSQIKDAKLQQKSADEFPDALNFLFKTLKGDKGDTVVGPPGPAGKDGRNMKFEDLTPEQKREIKGEKGDSVVGPAGKDGKDGRDGRDGKDGRNADEESLFSRIKGFAIDLIPIEVRKQIDILAEQLTATIEEKIAKIAQSAVRQSGSGGHPIHVGPNPPGHPRENDLWVDTSGS